ncbi:hypothetical protein LINPERPRIM_LOCUS37808, partial [Linum perenne]
MGGKNMADRMKEYGETYFVDMGGKNMVDRMNMTNHMNKNLSFGHACY